MILVNKIKPGGVNSHRIIAKCECDHPWHYIQFSWFTSGVADIPELYAEVGLAKYGFWKRLKYGIKYILGYSNDYFMGGFETATLDVADTKILIEELQKALTLMEIEEQRFYDYKETECQKTEI